MTIIEIRKLLEAHQDQIEELNVAQLSVFGSVARNEASSQSDVDILVDFKGPATFIGYTELMFRLEKILGVKVDLVTRKALRPALKSQIESEAVRVA